MIEQLKSTNPIPPFRIRPEPSKSRSFTSVAVPPLEVELAVEFNIIVLLPTTTAVAEVSKLRMVPPMVIAWPPGASVLPEIRNSVSAFAVIGEALKVMFGTCCASKAVDDLETTLGNTDLRGDFPDA